MTSISDLKDAIVNKCNGLISSHNSDSNAHSLSTVARSGSYNDLLDKPVIPSANWSTQSLGSYGTLYVNETLRLVIFYYSRNYKFTATTDTLIESNVVPSEFRPQRETVGCCSHPSISGYINRSGDVYARSSSTSNLGLLLTVIYTY